MRSKSGRAIILTQRFKDAASAFKVATRKKKSARPLSATAKARAYAQARARGLERGSAGVNAKVRKQEAARAEALAKARELTRPQTRSLVKVKAAAFEKEQQELRDYYEGYTW